MSEEQKTASAKYSTPKVATRLIPNDEISVNLVAQEPDGQRIAVSATFNHMGEPINAATKQAIYGDEALDLSKLSGSAAPEFPMLKYQELVESGQVEAAEDLKTAHTLEVEAWENKGNRTLPDSIVDAILDWAARAHNVSTEDHNGPVIKPEQIVVKNVVRQSEDQPGIFAVSLNPQWGF